jgi:threonyl-tRNA synthetase
MASAVSLTFPDGSKREYPAGTTGREVAESISKSLAKKAVAIALDGELTDLSDPVRDGALEIVTRTDPRALELIRHDTAHVMAEAVQELFPGTQVTIGPVIENGFYYDFARNAAVHAGRPAGDREEDEGDHRPQQAFHQGGLVAR